MKTKFRSIKENMKSKGKKILTMLVPTLIMMPQVTFAASTNRSTVIATPVFFTGTVALLAALLTLVLGLVGGYVTIQVVIEFFKYIDAEPEERKLHMKGIKGKAMGGIGAVCASGVIAWALAFYA